MMACKILLLWLVVLPFFKKQYVYMVRNNSCVCLYRSTSYKMHLRIQASVTRQTYPKQLSSVDKVPVKVQYSRTLQESKFKGKNCKIVHFLKYRIYIYIYIYIYKYIYIYIYTKLSIFLWHFIFKGFFAPWSWHLHSKTSHSTIS